MTLSVGVNTASTPAAIRAEAAATTSSLVLAVYYLMDGGIITVNTDTCALIGKQADYACFDSMGEVVEVTTTKD